MAEEITKEQIRELRGELSQPAFGEVLGVTGNYVYSLENGRHPVKRGPLRNLLRLLLKLQGSGRELPRARLAAIEEAAREAKEAGSRVSLDPAQVLTLVEEILRCRASS